MKFSFSKIKKQTKRLLYIGVAGTALQAIPFVGNDAFGQILDHGQAATQSNLVFWLNMDGNANDASGNGFHGDLQGVNSSATDRFGNPDGALAFNGSTFIEIECEDLPLESQARTLAFWVKMDSDYADLDIPMAFAGYGDADDTEVLDPHGMFYALTNYYGYAGELYNMGWGNDVASSDFREVDLIDDNWHHVAITYAQDDTSRTLYVDGQLVIRTVEPFTQTTLNTRSSSFYIGALFNTLNEDGNYFYNGDMDDLRLYSSELSANEVFELYSAPRTISVTTPQPSLCNTGTIDVTITHPQKDITYQLIDLASTDPLSNAITVTNFIDTLTITSYTITSTLQYGVRATYGANSLNMVSNGSFTVTVLPAFTIIETFPLQSCVYTNGVADSCCDLKFTYKGCDPITSWFVQSGTGLPSFEGTGDTSPIITYGNGKKVYAISDVSSNTLLPTPYSDYLVYTFSTTCGTSGGGGSQRPVVTETGSINVKGSSGNESANSNGQVGKPGMLEDLHLNAFPNPTNGYFTIQYNLGETKEGTAIIYDLVSSREIQRFDLNSQQGELEADLSNFSEGVYKVVMMDQNQILSTQKVVLIK